MRGRGWIHLHRKLYDPDHWLAPSHRDPACKRDAWNHICVLAQHAGFEHAGERLERGEVLLSTRWCAGQWKWSISKTSRFLLRLGCDEMIGTVRDTPRGTIYRVIAYSTYNDVETPKRDTQRDTQRDTTGTLAVQEQEQRMKTLTLSHAELSDWMGEHATTLDGLDDITRTSLWGLYGPSGTDPKVWGDSRPEDRPRFMATAVLRWKAEVHERLQSRLFRRILQTVIEEDSQDDRPRNGRGPRSSRGPSKESRPSKRPRPIGQGEFKIG